MNWRRLRSSMGSSPQHDCSHGAFFHRRFANDWVGRVIGVLTLTPYDFWRRAHAVHHATSGNLERRGDQRRVPDRPAALYLD
jgi:fatty acid desaturase